MAEMAAWALVMNRKSFARVKAVRRKQTRERKGGGAVAIQQLLVAAINWVPKFKRANGMVLNT